ncbi:serine hydrolase domain-containing protein [Halobaculum litoreum]|uniref:serine hydrolase domain-containing protein n=1 Tax=Halobaculum litoreum TaxID=3031998 RepID=UPI0024C41D65|nr:serine hydrolase domain-containing protein [Halobaculum sp. DT92]
MVQETDFPTRHRIDDLVTAWLADADCPGASVAITDDTDLVHAAGYGHRSLDPELPATPTTRYGVGSVTKTVTATAVRALVDRGALEVTDPVATYVPYFDAVPGEPVTVRDLLTHTSGMPSDDLDAHVLAATVLDTDLGVSLDDWSDFEAFLAGRSDRRLTDRQRFLYSNSGYVVLARLVEAVSGEPFREFVDRTVLTPAGMTRTTFDVGAAAGDDDVATPHLRAGADLRPATYPDHFAFEPIGGLLAPVTDVAAFLRRHIDGGSAFGAALADEAYDAQVVVRTPVGGEPVGYGYGWYVRPFDGDRLVGHSGNTGVSAGYAGFLRERGLGIAIGCAAPPRRSPETLAVELLADLTDTVLAAVSPRTALDETLDSLTGRYASDGGFHTVTVERDGPTLVLVHETPLGGQELRFRPRTLDGDEYTFGTLEDDGSETVAEFFPSPEGVDLLVDRVLVERVDGGTEGDGGEAPRATR